MLAFAILHSAGVQSSDRSMCWPWPSRARHRAPYHSMEGEVCIGALGTAVRLSVRRLQPSCSRADHGANGSTIWAWRVRTRCGGQLSNPTVWAMEELMKMQPSRSWRPVKCGLEAPKTTLVTSLPRFGNDRLSLLRRARPPVVR